jgi:cation transport ATPase
MNPSNLAGGSMGHHPSGDLEGYGVLADLAMDVRWLLVIVGMPLLEMVPLMLVLLMSAAPVALPVKFTVSMAAGSKELAKRGVLITRLSAAEDAATMDVLCVGKTGMSAMSQLAVIGVMSLDRAREADVLFAGAPASREANQDPIDLTFLAAAKERHICGGMPAAIASSIRFVRRCCRREAQTDDTRAVEEAR